MPYKNDNLEELFQAAANDYPLRTDNSSWSNVADKLNAVTTVADKSNAWKYAAALILLLGAAVVGYLTQTNSNKQLPTNVATVDQPKSIDAAQQQKNQQSIKKDVIETAKSTLYNNNSIHIEISKSGKKNITASNSNHTKSSDYSIPNKQKETDQISSSSINTDLNKNDLQQNSFITNSQNSKIVSNNLNDNANSSSLLNQNVNDAAEENNSSMKQQDMITYKASKAKFYGSLFGGPEFTMIKSQHINKPGYRVGVALAYRINNRLDVELGLQREHINYFTNGQYFDKSGLNLKDAVSLEDLNANSMLTSVPITVRYNFQSKGAGHFYVGGGFNALVLTHTEKYQYTVSRNGTVNDRSKNYKSVTSAKYFSSINASAGYQNKLCNWCDYKVEPYYQIPVTKLGVGKLPVSNFGLNIGIVKDLR